MRAAFATIATAFVIAAPGAADAATCATEPVTARGEPARFEWLAKTQARANWRRKVRAMPNLGAPYAQWPLAEAATERCIRAERTIYCIFTGLPCRT